MAQGNAVILLIENDRELSTLLSSALQFEGHAVVPVHCWEEKLPFFQFDAFDMIITDLAGSSRGCFESIENIREMAPETPIIAISTRGAMASGHLTRARAAKAQVDLHLDHPFTLEVLLDSIDQFLTHGRVGSAA